MAKKKQHETETEISENQFVESNPETKKENSISDNADAFNDAGSYDFTGKTFGEKTEVEIETPSLDVDALLSEYAPKKRGRKPKEETAPPLLIPGELIIHVCDNIMVGGIGFIDSFLSKNPIDAQMLSLNEEQRKQLIPSANAVSVELSKYINANPVTAFFAMLGSMYLSNYMIIRALMIQVDKQKPSRSRDETKE